jgi:2-polyprenyl-3-methyl-5-hydroxy-6-metoxy-1,4-benzoquinol methylase
MDALKRTGITEGSLLDYGCGNGAYRDILGSDAATRGLRYTGADINAELMRWCTARYPDNRFEPLTTGPSPFNDGEFDVVLASGVLHLVEDYAALLREWHRVSRGYVLITRLPLRKYNPTALWMVNVSHTWGEESYPARILNRGDFESNVVATGFEIVYRDYNDVFITHPGVSERAVFHLYLLKKH